MKILSLVAAAIAAIALSACSTVSNLSVLDRDETPRTAAILVAEDLTPALTDVALLCEAGVIGEETKGLIATHGPTLNDVVTRYFETAEACVVVDGALQSDPTASGECRRGTVREASRALPTELARLSSAFGLENDVGRGLFLASVVSRRIVGNNDGGVIDGFTKDDELTREEYIAALQPLRDARDDVAVCVARTGAVETIGDPIGRSYIEGS